MRWQQVPEADQEPLTALIVEMNSIGYNEVQWGVNGIVLGRKDRVPAFFEAFGKAFIRGDGESVLVAAQKALVIMKAQDACTHPAVCWKYTHSNGHKTCGVCRYFAPCTVDEALAHYDHGEVQVPDQNTYLMFDFRRPLCPACGGHRLLHDQIFDIHRCDCGQRMETVTDDMGFPQHDEQHYRKLRPVDADPPVVGFWHAGKSLWLGEDGHAKTYRLADIHGWRQGIIADDLEDPALQLRLVNVDLTPGDLVPFSYDREADVKEFVEGLDALAQALTAKGKGPTETDRVDSTTGKAGDTT